MLRVTLENVAVEQKLILKEQQEQTTLVEGKIKEEAGEDRPRGQPVVEGRNISWDGSKKKTQIVRVLKIRKNGQKKNFSFHTQ